MKKSGFVLIEIIVAILVLSFTVLYTFELLTTGFMAYKKSSTKTLVTKHAQTKLEYLAAQGGPTPLPPATPLPPLLSSGEIPYAQNLHFSYHYDTTPVPDIPPILLHLNEVEMTVNGPYEQGGQRARNFQEITLITYLPSSLEELMDGGTCLSPGGP
jgi:prepilin-type N-terminal cleavage/methylation domain-containing protein